MNGFTVMSNKKRAYFSIFQTHNIIQFVQCTFYQFHFNTCSCDLSFDFLRSFIMIMSIYVCMCCYSYCNCIQLNKSFVMRLLLFNENTLIEREQSNGTIPFSSFTKNTWFFVQQKNNFYWIKSYMRCIEHNVLCTLNVLSYLATLHTIFTWSSDKIDFFMFSLQLTTKML